MKSLKKCLLLLSSLSLLASCSSSSSSITYDEMDKIAKNDFTSEKALAAYEGSGKRSTSASYPNVTDEILKAVPLAYFQLSALPITTDSETVLTSLCVYSHSSLEDNHQIYVQGKEADDTYLKNANGTYSLQFTYSDKYEFGKTAYGVAVDIQKTVNEVGLLLSTDLVAAFSNDDGSAHIVYRKTEKFTWTKKA